MYLPVLADTPFAELATLKPRTEGSSQDFLTWFNYQRIFQFNTWGHLALVAAFLVFELVPTVVGTLLKILRLLLGGGAKAVACTEEDGKTFQQALEDGAIRVRFAYGHLVQAASWQN
jgi:hypothetical protein